MSYIEQKTLAEELQNVFEQFKEVNEKKSVEINKIGEETRETRNTLTKMNDRIDDLETKLNRPRISGEPRVEENEYKAAFEKWFRRGEETEIKANFPNINETIDPMGGFLVPPQYADYIIESLVQYSPIRELANVVSVNRKEFKIPYFQQAQNLQTGAVQNGMFRAGWTADLGPVTQTDTPLFGQKTIPTCDLYAEPFATQDQLDDSMFDMQNLISRNLARTIAYYEGNAFTVGNGVGQPTGIVTGGANYTQVNTGDNTGWPAPAALGNSNATNVLIEAYYALPDFYARNATWLMNRQTIRQVREFVDTNGQYIWTPNFGTSLAGEGAGMILGRPYREVIDMVAPDAAGQFAQDDVMVLFGDVRSAYTIVDRKGMTMLRDPFTEKPFVIFYTTYRVGGDVVLPEAMVKIVAAV